MKLIEERQREIDEQLGIWEARQIERERFTTWEPEIPRALPAPKPIPVIPRQSFTVNVASYNQGKKTIHRLCLLAIDRDQAEWAALATTPPAESKLIA